MNNKVSITNYNDLLDKYNISLKIINDLRKQIKTRDRSFISYFIFSSIIIVILAMMLIL